MPVSYTAKATRLTDPDGSGAAAARTPNAGEPAADFNDLDTAMAAVVALANANETAVAGKANASHTHAATDVTSGVLNPARLGSGTANTTTYLRGDGTWAAVAGGGGTPADATTTTKGIVQLAGDLGGTAAAPTVPGLATHTHPSAWSVFDAMTYDQAWRQNSTDVLRLWLARHARPQVTISATPVDGVVTVVTQADADALKGKKVRGRINFTGTTAVTLEDFEIEYNPAVAPDTTRSLLNHTGSGALTVRRFTIDGGGGIGNTHGAGTWSSAGIGGDSFRTINASRFTIKGCAFDAIRGTSPGTYTDFWLHSFPVWDDAVQGRAYNGSGSQDTDPHTDGMQVFRGTFTVQRGLIDMDHPNDGRGNNLVSGMMIKPDSAAITSGLVEFVELRGADYTVQFHNHATNGDPTGVVFRDVRIGRTFRTGVYSISASTAGLTRTRVHWNDVPLAAVPTASGATSRTDGLGSGGGGTSTLTVRTVTAATTLAGTDQYLRVNASSGVTVTVPTGLTTGSVFEVRQVGAGQVTIAGAGVTFTPSTELKTAGQHTSVRLIVTGTNAVDVDGGVA